MKIISTSKGEINTATLETPGKGRYKSFSSRVWYFPGSGQIVALKQPHNAQAKYFPQRSREEGKKSLNLEEIAFQYWPLLDQVTIAGQKIILPFFLSNPPLPKDEIE